MLHLSSATELALPIPTLLAIGAVVDLLVLIIKVRMHALFAGLLDDPAGYVRGRA